jgi:hypothetical protein
VDAIDFVGLIADTMIDRTFIVTGKGSSTGVEKRSAAAHDERRSARATSGTETDPMLPV